MDGVCKLGPLVALYAGDPKLMEYAETMVRITQDNEIAVKYALAGNAHSPPLSFASHSPHPRLEAMHLPHLE